MPATIVKSWSGTNSSSSTSITFTVPAGGVAVGNRLVIGLNGNGVGTLAATPATDTKGNTWQADRPSTATTGGQFVGAKITTALVAGDTITVTGTTSIAGRVGIAVEISGLTDTPVDIENAGTATNAAPIFTETVLDTAQADELLIGFIALSSVNTALYTAVGQGATEIARAAGNSSRAILLSHKTLSSVQKPVVSGTLSASTAWRTGYIAYKIAAAGAPTPTLNSRVVGVDGSVKVRTTNATSVRLKAGTDAAVTTGVVWSSAVTPNAAGASQPQLTGLTAGTRYYYRVAMTNADGVETLDTDATVGRIEVAPTGAASFAFNFSSCTDATDSASMAAIAARGDDLFFHLGDLFYSVPEPGAVTEAGFRSEIDAKITATNHKAVFATTPTSYGPSDHDSTRDNNGNGSTHPTALTLFNQVYRERFPTPAGMPATTGLYYSFTWGRVLFVQLDCRTFASAPGTADSSSKTMLGATQKGWLFNLLDTTTAKVLVMLGDTAWSGALDVTSDAWEGYVNERTAIEDKIIAVKASRGLGVVYLSGDQHAVGADNGASNRANMPLFAGSPLNNAASQKTTGWSAGIYPASGTTVVQQYARIAVTDVGGNLTFAYTGYSSDNTSRITQTSTFSPPQGTGSGTTTNTGTAVGSKPTRGTGSGATAYAGTATGTTVRKGTASGSTAYAGSATGTTVRKGTAAGATVYAGTATGTTVRSGTATGSTVWVGSATGEVIRSGTGSGTTQYTGTAEGEQPPADQLPSGTGSGSTVYVGTAVGQRSPYGEATGTTEYVGTATGQHPDVQPGRNITITSVTEPANRWTVTEPTTAWATTDPTNGWDTGQPVTDWTTTDPSPIRAWLTTEPTSAFTVTEPALAYTASEPTQ